LSRGRPGHASRILRPSRSTFTRRPCRRCGRRGRFRLLDNLDRTRRHLSGLPQLLQFAGSQRLARILFERLQFLRCRHRTRRRSRARYDSALLDGCRRLHLRNGRSTHERRPGRRNARNGLHLRRCDCRGGQRDSGAADVLRLRECGRRHRRHCIRRAHVYVVRLCDVRIRPIVVVDIGDVDLVDHRVADVYLAEVIPADTVGRLIDVTRSEGEPADRRSG